MHAMRASQVGAHRQQELVRGSKTEGRGDLSAALPGPAGT